MNKASGILNADDVVEEAARRINRLAALEGSERHEAFRRIAARDRLSVGFLKAVTQPSRRPKSIAAHLWDRLERAYVAAIRRQLSNLEAELDRIGHVGGDDAAVQALVDRAETLAREARRLTRYCDERRAGHEGADQ